MRVLVSAARTGRRREEIAEACERHRVPFEVVPEGALARIAGAAHNGMAAEVRQEEAAPRAAGDPELVVLLEDVQDPRNLGALLRVCEGAGVGRVLIRDRGSAPLTPTVTKTSAGATEWSVGESSTTRPTRPGYRSPGAGPAGGGPDTAAMLSVFW